MDQATSAESGQLTVQQMFATLLGEIAKLRKQNKDQQRQLEHLRSTTSLLLERDSSSMPTSRMARFKHFPLEIREMIWELAIPNRLLALKGVETETGAPLALSIPAVAHVCRESRRVFTARSGRDHSYLEGPNLLWRLKHKSLSRWTHKSLPRWTSFRPHSDALLMDPRDFARPARDESLSILLMTEVAEHIIVDDPMTWEAFRTYGFEPGRDWALTGWLESVVGDPEYTPSPQAPISTRAPVCHLRTIDFAMRSVTKIDRNYPPSLIRVLFAGDRVRIVDLRDKGAVDEIIRKIENAMYQVLHPERYAEAVSEIEDSLNIFRQVARKTFPRVKSEVLKTLVCEYYAASVTKNTAYLEPPVNDDDLEMEVHWVRELSKRITIRPVHVFVLAEGMSETDW